MCLEVLSLTETMDNFFNLVEFGRETCVEGSVEDWLKIFEAIKTRRSETSPKRCSVTITKFNYSNLDMFEFYSPRNSLSGAEVIAAGHEADELVKNYEHILLRGYEYEGSGI